MTTKTKKRTKTRVQDLEQIIKIQEKIIKANKKVDGTTSIWTSENFTAIDAAITSGKSKIGAL